MSNKMFPSAEPVSPLRVNEKTQEEGQLIVSYEAYYETIVIQPRLLVFHCIWKTSINSRLIRQAGGGGGGGSGGYISDGERFFFRDKRCS